MTALAAAAALLAAAIAVTAGVPRPLAAAAYAGGSPAGFSGGFQEEACDACHFSAKVNSGPGTETIGGVPGRYSPGARIPLTVTLARDGMTLAGFQLTARFADGRQAGALEAAPGEATRIAVETQGGIQYAGQRQAGTASAGAGVARWSLVWTAPAGGGDIMFHVAANAADGDGTAEGDFVFTAGARSSAGSGAGEQSWLDSRDP